MRTDKKYFSKIILSGMILVFLFFVGILYFSFKKEDVIFNTNINTNIGASLQSKDNEIIPPPMEEKKVPRKIDGILFLTKENLDTYPQAIIIENFIDARPLFGLNEANLVYEALAEAGITRFLAIYSGVDVIEKIGPIRSARPYFLDWAEEYQAIFSHCGGSPEALKLIDKTQIFDLNEYFNSSYFWRDQTKNSPHNLFTSTELLNNYWQKFKNKPVINYQDWLYKDFKLNNDYLVASEITINYSQPFYQVVWKYEKENNNYQRFINNEPDIDGLNNFYFANNIIVQKVKTTILDEIGRKQMITIGQGEAFIFLDGIVVNGSWRKNKKGERTKFFNSSNEEIQFNRGKTWINVVPSNLKILYN